MNLRAGSVKARCIRSRSEPDVATHQRLPDNLPCGLWPTIARFAPLAVKPRAFGAPRCGFGALTARRVRADRAAMPQWICLMLGIEREEKRGGPLAAAASLVLRSPVVRSSSSSRFPHSLLSRRDCSARCNPKGLLSFPDRIGGSCSGGDCRRGERGSVRPPARWRFRARYPPLNHSLPHLPAYLAEKSVLAQSRPIVSTRSEL